MVFKKNGISRELFL